MLLGCCLVFLGSHECVRADNSSPTVCSGFDEKGEPSTFHLLRTEPSSWVCPAGMVIMAHREVSAPLFSPVSSYPLDGSCCPIPKDALLDEHRWVDDECPDGFVGTGARSLAEEGFPSPLRASKSGLHYQLRCTKVNREKYDLAQETNGWLMGFGVDVLKDFFAHPLGQYTPRTLRVKLPAGIRYGILRQTQYVWEEEGCLGHPWGSILVGRRYLHCSGMIFRQLLFRSSPSAAVPVIPDCEEVDDPYSTHPLCKTPSPPAQKTDLPPS